MTKLVVLLPMAPAAFSVIAPPVMSDEVVLCGLMAPCELSVTSLAPALKPPTDSVYP